MPGSRYCRIFFEKIQKEYKKNTFLVYDRRQKAGGRKMKLKILIVEDDKLLAEAVSDYFKGKGCETRTEG